MRTFKRPFSEIEDKSKLEAWSGKNAFTPYEVGICSEKKATFRCHKPGCGHEFSTKLYEVYNGKWCPFCAGKRRCDDVLNCSACLKKTFFGYREKQKVDCWSDKNDAKPWTVSIASNTKYVFSCSVCKHDFEASTAAVTSKHSWCPFCCRTAKLCDNARECLICLPKTFFGVMAREIVECWSEKNKKKAWECTKGSDYKATFCCNKCGHEFRKVLNNIYQGGWCPFCAHKKLCDNARECVTCLPKTFFWAVSPDVVQCWSEKNKKHPWDFFACSNQNAYFCCEKCGYEFRTRLHTVYMGSWCPRCAQNKNKAMVKLCAVLDEKGVGYTLEVGIKLNNRSLHWDACCTFEGNDFFIESDGQQHFSQKAIRKIYRGTLDDEQAAERFEDQRARDLLKETYAKVNNKLLFRFSYRQTGQIESLVVKMLDTSRSGKTGVVYMDDIYW